MRCSICGGENREGARFCDRCGGALDTTVVRHAADPELESIRIAFHERYQVEALLGRGGMGAVYKAREHSLDRHVALKVVPERLNDDSTFIERFRRESRLAARLRHPRIVSVHEVGKLGNFHYFSMDFIEGATLRAVIERRGRLPAEDAISIAAEICRAVAHAHAREVIHRDLKPENVMIDNEGDVFVMDFGLARAATEPGITASGTVMGTPLYMSPEQLGGEEVDERSDIFAIGLILYYCLTGEDLYAADSVTGVVAKHATTRVAEVIHAHATLPLNLQELLISMLEARKENRARTVREVLERLTLRKIVALGLEATGETMAPTVPMMEPVTPPPAVEDNALAVVATRRKARLRSLLDEM